MLARHGSLVSALPNRHIHMEFSRRVGVLKLNGGVMDIEVVGQDFANPVGDLLGL